MEPELKPAVMAKASSAMNWGWWGGGVCVCVIEIWRKSSAERGQWELVRYHHHIWHHIIPTM